MFVSLGQSLAAALPPHEATAAVLLAAALAAALSSLVARRGTFSRTLPASAFVALGAALFWPLRIATLPAAAAWAAAALAGAGLLCHLWLHRAEPTEIGAATAEETAGRLYLAGILATTAWLLFHDLGGYAGSVLAWESAVVTWYAQGVLAGQSVLEVTARAFLWDNGILSAGNTSLFFGAPTYALFWIAGFSTWTLRFFAAAATLLSVGVMYASGRRAFGGVVGVAAAAFFGLGSVVLFYGRYGSSLAGTLLAVLLALWSVWVFLERERAWWMGAVCALALYAATLQYATARIVVLILLGFTVVVSLWQWRSLWWRRALGLALLGAGVAGVWQLQTWFRTQHIFLLARGEQFLALIQHRDYLRSVLGHAVEPESLTFLDKLDLAWRLVQITVPQYLALLTPRLQRGEAGLILTVDPPPLQFVYGPLVLLILWGLAYSLARLRSWRHLSLLAWFAGSTVPLLLTNRVDAHRMALLVVPLTFWAAIGAGQGARVLAQAHVPRFLRHALAIALGLTLVLHDVDVLYYPEPIPPLAGRALAAEAEAAPGPVVVGALIDHRQVAWAELPMLERARHHPDRTAGLLAEATLFGIADVATPAESHLREVERLVQGSTLLLMPVERFRAAAAVLQQRGLRVEQRGTPPNEIIRVDAAPTGGAGEPPPAPLPTVAIPPTAAPIPLREGPRTRLTSLAPRAVSFGFEPPVFDRAWGGAPLQLGGVTYTSGIGVHAWTRLEYAVPPGAVAFQAIVGVADGACEKASVAFELRDARDAVLLTTGTMFADTPPRPLELDLRGQEVIVLLVTDAGDGRDCDHVNWVESAFLVGSGADKK